jgi:rod shape-determining protein MreC
MNRSRDIAHSHASPKLLIHRGIFALCVVTGVTLLALGRADNPTLMNARMHALAAMAPVLDAVRTPVESWRDARTYMTGLFHAHEENKSLRAQLERMQRWQSVSMALETENSALRALMDYVPRTKARYVTAKVLADMEMASGHELLIDVGAHTGIQTYQPVIDAAGLIGRIIDRQEGYARVLGITDANSRIPVVTGDSRIRAIASGTGDDMLRLQFIAGTMMPALGELVFTSDDGGLMPSGVVIGTVSRISDDVVWVKPARPIGAADYVRVMQLDRIAPKAK